MYQWSFQIMYIFAETTSSLVLRWVKREYYIIKMSGSDLWETKEIWLTCDQTNPCVLFHKTWHQYERAQTCIQPIKSHDFSSLYQFLHVVIDNEHCETLSWGQYLEAYPVQITMVIRV